MRWLLMLVGLSACGGCDDEVSLDTDLGATFDVRHDAQTTRDFGIVDLGTSDATAEDTNPADMEAADAGVADASDLPIKPSGPRTDVTFTAHDIVFEPRISHFNIVPTNDAFYLATSSAGEEVAFSLGDPDELVITAAPLDTFGAIWARYSNGLSIEAADQISFYPGGPRRGGTSNGDQLVVEDDGSRIMAGGFFGSVDFGGTVWSSNFTNSGGVLTTSSGGYVVRTTDNTIQAMFRLRTSRSDQNTSITGLVTHDDGDLTIAGPMQNEVIFPDNSTLTDGRGFLARTNATGSPDWSMALPSLPYLTDAGDRVLVRFSYRDAFTIGATSYAAPTTGYGIAFAAIDADGEVDWIQRIEAAAFMAYTREPRVAADGRIVVPFNARGPATALDTIVQPDLSEDGHLWLLDPDGSLVWAATAPPESEYHSIALDDSGVIWAAAGICDVNGTTVQAKWGAPLTIAPCDPATGPTTWVLLGLDPEDGSTGFAHALFRGAASVDDVEVLSNGAVVVGAHYFDPTTVNPDAADAFEVDQLGTGANDLNGLLLLFE